MPVVRFVAKFNSVCGLCKTGLIKGETVVWRVENNRKVTYVCDPCYSKFHLPTEQPQGRCTSTTKKGSRCTNSPLHGASTCHIHNPYMQCGYVDKYGKRCNMPTGGGTCKQHSNRGRREKAKLKIGGVALRVSCPTCRIPAGRPCFVIQNSKPMHVAPHDDRVALYEQMQIPAEELPARMAVREVACPECATVPGEPCYTPSGRTRNANHQARITAYVRGGVL